MPATCMPLRPVCVAFALQASGGRPPARPGTKLWPWEVGHSCHRHGLQVSQMCRPPPASPPTRHRWAALGVCKLKPQQPYPLSATCMSRKCGQSEQVAAGRSCSKRTARALGHAGNVPCSPELLVRLLHCLLARHIFVLLLDVQITGLTPQVTGGMPPVAAGVTGAYAMQPTGGHQHPPYQPQATGCFRLSRHGASCDWGSICWCNRSSRRSCIRLQE